MRHGLLVMSYGSPTSPEGIEEYYTDIRRGRPPSPEQLADLQRRYEAIGGTSALARRTGEQMDAISRSLEADESRRWIVELGTKHSVPSIEAAVGALLGADVELLVGLVLAPHHSAASVGEYHRRARRALEEATAPEHRVTYHAIDNWHMLTQVLEFHARGILNELPTMPERSEVVFTAHSLPERLLEGDPYPEQLRESAAATAAMAGLPRSSWSIGWQSAGATPEPWRGPDLLTIIDDLAATDRADAILVVPHGFTSEHLEVLYDLDIEAVRAAAEVGLQLRRTPVFNDDPSVMDALASLVGSTAPGANR